MSAERGTVLRGVCPLCGRPVVEHDDDTARWCYRAWLARDPRGLADPARDGELETVWRFP